MGMIGERGIELDQLIDGLVAHERLAHKEHQVGRVHGDQLGQRAHQRLVVLRIREKKCTLRTTIMNLY